MNIHHCLNRLLDALPLHAEEGNAREVLPESDLLMKPGDGLDVAVNTAVLQMVRTVFESMSLLDRKLLLSGQWAFVSFPASLAARSLLTTLSTPGQTMFDEHYWEQGAHRPKAATEEQRQLLHELETRRERYHPTHAAQPIRTVHVAWGVIKIDERFLLIHREDKKRANVSNFVFPGGRLNLIDLPVEANDAASLRDLFQSGI